MRRPRGRSRPPARPRSRPESPPAAARSPRPGRSARSGTCRRGAARRADRSPVSRDVIRVVESDADDLHSHIIARVGSAAWLSLRCHGPARPAVHAVPRADRARRAAGLRVRLDVRLARPLARIDAAARARRRPDVDDEARPLRDEPGHARPDGAREHVRDAARHVGRADGDGDRPRRLGASA